MADGIRQNLTFTNLLMKTIFLFFLVFSAAFCNAISINNLIADTGKTEVVLKDSLIDDLVIKKTAVNKKTGGKVAGYRVQIHFGPDKNKAKEMKTKFLIKYPDIAAYDDYDVPNFKVRVGDFKTKLEAFRLLKQIKEDFPGSFIVDDKVEMMKIE